jgi:hypothetical protein
VSNDLYQPERAIREGTAGEVIEEGWGDSSA